jgi:ornithine cyclodeaminase/alanine dehydrogenase
MMEANFLGQIRTGAASGFATDLMAKPGPVTAGIIGSGFQARSQLEAISAVREITRANVWSRSEEKRLAFAHDAQARLDLPVNAVESAEAALAGADIVITATNAKEPVLREEWLGPNVHINAIGSNAVSRRELPAIVIANAACIAVDSLEQAHLEAGDLLLAGPEGHWKNVVELHTLTGEWHRPTPGITIFKSLGLGIEDVAAAAHVYEQAVKHGVGSRYS